MTHEEIIEKLKDDSNYYGDFGKQFLSNSDIGTLFTNPTEFQRQSVSSVNLVIGSYLHTCVLEPHKLTSFKIIDASNRNVKRYKEESEGEICLLKHEADHVYRMRDALMKNTIIRDLIIGSHKDSEVLYEMPGIQEIKGRMWKGKADVINKDERLVIDLKSTSDIDNFHWSAYKYNYDSQAYLYREIFGVDLIFIVIDKKSLKINIFEVSDETLQRGEDKVEKAVEIFDLYYNTKDFNPNEYIETKII